ncbi:hypothetical protein AN936_06730 [Sphingopyxis macrogoltabida]|uniref:Uncharacterized protein n=1 Tax=Sphingopyxis macrogoltabida TaxID=33050 RepID=A0A0N7GS92_SPHMC|nr:hypothetical protein AN936_06730 [Sphingopyxis macrogoltabida]
MLLALLARRFAHPLTRISAQVTADPDSPRTSETVLRDIAQRISAGGADKMSNTDILIWNTAVVVGFMTGDRRIAVPTDARVLNWGAARAGFREMGLPDLAEFVRLFVGAAPTPRPSFPACSYQRCRYAASFARAQICAPPYSDLGASNRRP